MAARYRTSLRTVMGRMRMRKLAVQVLLLAVVVGAAGAADNPVSVGPGEGIVVPSGDDNPCPGSTLYSNHDGSFENGYAWRYGGIVPPYYGAFAEGFESDGYNWVCGAQFYLSTLSGMYFGQNMDVYVWDGDATNPNNVIGMTPGIVPGTIAIWPNISTHDIDIQDVYFEGWVYVGYWGNWPGGVNGWFIAADLDGFGGLPRTNIAPGIGYPTGWQDPSIVWGPTQSLGIGAYGGFGIPPPPPNPTLETTWGRIKELHR
jgi:hypothetical protein